MPSPSRPSTGGSGRWSELSFPIDMDSMPRTPYSKDPVATRLGGVCELGILLDADGGRTLQARLG